ncbi:MAG: LytTR family transcriptional regulator DNA-binding domain-containing protein [Clostridioides sp.]|jgi:DNA-binding LytR/AlgR family response regulator|nr:LytTR family transcriptional regulator DNA-binding domain-containing protein [Clostridioides sp.]
MLDQILYLRNDNYSKIEKGDLFSYKVYGKMSFADKKRIMYFQSNERKIKMFTVDGEDSFYNTINNLQVKFKEDGFIRIHKSCLVNCRYIKQFTYNKVFLYDGTELSVSRKYSKEAKEYLKKIFSK